MKGKNSIVFDLEATEKIILGENFDALGEQGEGSKIAASVAVATTIGEFWVLRRSYPRCIEIYSQKDFSDRLLEPISKIILGKILRHLKTEEKVPKLPQVWPSYDDRTILDFLTKQYKMYQNFCLKLFLR